MSIFAEFEIEGEALAFDETLETLPETVVEIERVAANESIVAPYFWVSGVPLSTFEDAVDDDPSIRNLERVDEFEDVGLYRAEWVDAVESLAHALLEYASVVLSATGSNECWEIELRFEDVDRLSEFRSFADEHDIAIQIRRLVEASQPLTGSQYDLTEKQQEALVAAWEAGYFETPRRTTLSEVADDLEITQQSLSDRLRRGHQTLIANTLTIQGPTGE